MHVTVQQLELDLDAGLSQPLGKALAVVAERIELATHDPGGRESTEIGRQQW